MYSLIPKAQHADPRHVLALGHKMALALSLLTLMLGGALATKPRAAKRDATAMIRSPDSGNQALWWWVVGVYVCVVHAASVHGRFSCDACQRGVSGGRLLFAEGYPVPARRPNLFLGNGP